MGVQFLKNIFIALFHLSKGLDHYENLKRIFPIFSLLFLFFSQISQESRGVKTMNRKLKQPGLRQTDLLVEATSRSLKSIGIGMILSVEPFRFYLF